MSFDGWTDGLPPFEWKRTLAIDVGGATPWAFEFGAVDPLGYLVFYDEVYETTTDVSKLANLVLPKMGFNEENYNWLFKCCDYENRIAMTDLKKHGIVVTNAIKHNKLSSIHRLAGYLHPNPKRPFPSWHPRAGEPGSPLAFIMARCKNLIREIPQQRWKEGTGDSLKDEADRSVDNHATDCALYTVRQLPLATDVKIVHVPKETDTMNLMSRLYWEDVRRQKELAGGGDSRRKYRPSHDFGGSLL